MQGYEKLCGKHSLRKCFPCHCRCSIREETNEGCCSVACDPAVVVAVTGTPQGSASAAGEEGTGAIETVGVQVQDASVAAPLARVRSEDVSKVPEVGDEDLPVLRHIEWLDDEGEEPRHCHPLPTEPEAQRGPNGRSPYLTSTARSTSSSDYSTLEEEWEITSTSLSDSSWQPSSDLSPSSEEYLSSSTTTSQDHTAALLELRTRNCVYPKRPDHEVKLSFSYRHPVLVPACAIGRV